ncbi:LPS assembly lipoprotein LptE [Ereboglobus luteus]|uniref:LPS assembly lipoprotein LptE n=1 Tax=Ereboglobus luteus TaxID=1796921 RepID=UPI0013749EA9|nr:LPS assembly lipoprotein LptE [Ereboglobus luteus]
MSCSHYQLGSGGKLPFRTIYIAPVENAANIPQGAAIFSAQLRESFVRDGRLAVVNSAAAADVTLTVTLERYTRNMTTSRADDSGLARKFDLTVLAVCTLQGANDGKVYFEKRPVSSTRQIFTTPTFDARQSDQLQAEYNAMPLLASSLASGVTHAVLDVW